jgi:hypothetical protein
MAIDDRDVDGQAAERLGGAYTAKSAAHDHDLMAARRGSPVVAARCGSASRGA